MLIIDSNNVLVDFVSEIQGNKQYEYGDPYNPELSDNNKLNQIIVDIHY